MLKHFIALGLIFGILYSQPINGQISCYQCNVGTLSSKFSSDCADPYVPSPAAHLLPCPQDEPHYCLKAAIFYNNHHLTVRGCIPSKSVNTYCAADNFANNFPDAEINCHYCEGDACNRSTSIAKPFSELTLGLVILIIIAANSGGVIIG